MTGEKSLYLVARGDYVSALLAQERWQFGLRLWADLSVPSDMGNLPTTGDFEADFHTVTGGGNTATSTWRWRTPTGDVMDPAQYLIDHAAAFSTFMTTANLSSQVRLKELRLYPVTEPAGHAFEGRSCVLTYGTPVSGLASGNPLPLEVTSAVSLRTNQVGPRGRGRFYAPIHSSAALDGTGFLSSTVSSALLGAAKALIEDLDLDPPLADSLHTRVSVIGGNFTQYAVVKKVRLGNILDAQRRRRRQLVETYSELGITP